MKKFLVLTIATCFIFNSCSMDDEGEEEFSIHGIWSPAREIAVSGSNGVTIYNDPSSSCYQYSTYDFKSNNMLAKKIYDTDITGTCENYGTQTVPYSYDHNAKKLVIENENIEIVSRTLGELQIVSHYEDVDDDNIDDKIIVVLVKQ